MLVMMVCHIYIYIYIYIYQGFFWPILKTDIGPSFQLQKMYVFFSNFMEYDTRPCDRNLGDGLFLNCLIKYIFVYNRKLGDGLFLKCCEEVSQFYPNIEFDTMIIDNCCMQVCQNPQPTNRFVVCRYV